MIMSFIDFVHLEVVWNDVLIHPPPLPQIKVTSNKHNLLIGV